MPESSANPEPAPVGKIVLSPWANRRPVQQIGARRTVRFGTVRPAPEKPDPVQDLEQRIQAARETAGNYESFAEKATTPAHQAEFTRLAAEWGKRLDELIAQKRAYAVQQEMILPNGRTQP